MNTAEIIYVGELRCEATHTQSGTTIITDAPTDNHGKGQAFSPTDLVAAALATCILTTIAILAQRDGMALDIAGTKAEVVKIMTSEPRRIAEIKIKITLPKNNYSEKEKKMIEKTAHTCPVARSLHPDLLQSIELVFP